MSKGKIYRLLTMTIVAITLYGTVSANEQRINTDPSFTAGYSSAVDAINKALVACRSVVIAKAQVLALKRTYQRTFFFNEDAYRAGWNKACEDVLKTLDTQDKGGVTGDRRKD